MNIAVKVILSILLLIIGFICLGAPFPYFPGRILVRISLFGAAMSGIGAVWKKRPVEGDIFKNKGQLNQKSNNTASTKSYLSNSKVKTSTDTNLIKEKLEDLKASGLLSETEYKTKINQIANEERIRDSEKKLNDAYDLGILTEQEYGKKLNETRQTLANENIEKDVNLKQKTCPICKVAFVNNICSSCGLKYSVD